MSSDYDRLVSAFMQTDSNAECVSEVSSLSHREVQMRFRIKVFHRSGPFKIGGHFNKPTVNLQLQRAGANWARLIRLRRLIRPTHYVLWG